MQVRYIVLNTERELIGIGSTPTIAIDDALESFTKHDEDVEFFLYKLTETHQVVVSEITAELVEEHK